MKQEEFEAKSAIEQLVAVMSMLRDREFGCPWDLEQSIASLVPYTLEEVYEVVDAIEKQDMAELEDELGDLLFQVVFYAQLAGEAGLFGFDDIVRTVTNKLLRRHPHVFPDGQVEKFGNKPDISADQVVVNWEAIKQLEKEEKLARQKSSPPGSSPDSSPDIVPSILDDVPRTLPALERARKLQKRAARAGFDWSDIRPVIARLKEEIEELEHAVTSQDQQHISEELGDVLFTAVNLARHGKVEPELALRSSNQRFEQRFRWIEQTLQSQGKAVTDADLTEMDSLWEQAKEQGL